MKTKRVVVGMSGGVDSSVAALLLKQQGYEVIGLFMKNWEEVGADGRCTSEQDYQDVAATCAALDIPYYSVNFVKEYQEKVFAEFLHAYKAGHTPNPDILCNKEIKFKVFFAKAMQLGADYLATGHYCQVIDGHLHKGVDPGKDQSYFLQAIDGKVLDKVLFPIGGLHKSKVRQIAAEHKLPTQSKKDSTGICFIGERNFTQFLGQYLEAQPGEFRHLDGSYVGPHRGVAYYTVGQRKKLGLGGEGEPWFVVGKDVGKNIVYVERGEHPALFVREIYTEKPDWIVESPRQWPYRCKAKIRYRQQDQECTLYQLEDGGLRVEFAQPQRGVALRQALALYDGDECLGGATIAATGPTEHEKEAAQIS